MSREKVLEYLRKKVKELEEELNMYRNLISIVEGGREEPSVEEIKLENVRVITADGDVVANVIETKGGIRVILRESIPADSALLNSFLIRVLEERKECGDIKDYRVKVSKGFISEIEVLGRSDLIYRELELALKYLWRELHKGEPSA